MRSEENSLFVSSGTVTFMALTCENYLGQREKGKMPFFPPSVGSDLGGNFEQIRNVADPP